MTTNNIIDDYKYLLEVIDQRTIVHKVVGATNEYIAETEKLIKQKNNLTKQITAHYDSIRSGRVGMFESCLEFMERMENTLEVDEDGNVVETYYKLGIGAIDNEFFNGKGVFPNSLIAIGADSAVGKTTLALQIISSLAIQSVNSQFYSFEMGDRQFFNEVNPQAKNKLKRLLQTEFADNLSFDFHSREINELANSIQMRADDGVKAFVIDSYLSIYTGGSEFDKMTELTDMLATLKKELGVLIIVIAQISKSDSFNQVYDFSGGTKLKYESDVALFIRLLEGEEHTTKRLMYCEKNRIFEDKQKFGIVTEYNRETHKIEKIANFKDYAGMGADGKELRPLKGFGKK